jgi:hypothetical protein
MIAHALLLAAYPACLAYALLRDACAEALWELLMIGRER